METRHLLKREPATDLGKAIFARGLKYLTKCLRHQEVTKISGEEAIEKYSGPKRKVYELALQQYKAFGLSAKDRLLKSFVKTAKTETPESDDPRIIQARSPKFNVAISQYHQPVEHVIYNILSLRKYTGRPVSRMSAKGHNLWERAREINRRFSQFGEECVVAMLDCSRFDGHVRKYQQMGAHSLYGKLLYSAKYRELLSSTLKSVGVTSGGYKYKLGGRRASGDCDTACGNTVIMLAMLTGALFQLGVDDFDIYGDGDDVLVFTTRKYRKIITEKLPLLFHEMGHKLRYVDWAETLPEIVFCRSRVVQLDRGFKMCRDPNLVLNTAFTSHKYFGDKFGAEMLKAYAYGYNAVHAGEPILGPLMRAMMDKVGARPDLVAYDKDLHWTVKNAGELRGYAISNSARYSYERAWGVSVEEQLHTEAVLLERLRLTNFTFPITHVSV